MCLSVQQVRILRKGEGNIYTPQDSEKSPRLHVFNVKVRKMSTPAELFPFNYAYFPSYYCKKHEFNLFKEKFGKFLPVAQIF